MTTQLNSPIQAEITTKNILLYAVIIIALGALLSFVYVSTSSDNNNVNQASNQVLNEPPLVQLPGNEISSNAQNNFLIGGMVMLCFATFILLLSTKRRINLLLFIYCIIRTLLLIRIVNNDFKGNEYFSGALSITSPLLTICSAFVMLLFTVEFFSLKKRFSTLQKKRSLFFVLFILSAGLTFFTTAVPQLLLSITIQTAVALILLVISIYLINKKQPFAKPFALIIAIQFVFLSAFLITQQSFGIEKIKYINLFYGLPFWINAFLMTSLLSQQYFAQMMQQIKLHKQALIFEKEARKAQEALLTAQLDDQEALESRVQERTLELTITLQELEESNKELAAKNTHDDLTGLYNRRYYDQKIQAEYRRSKRNLTPLSIVIIDIDLFKKVNDTYGHLTGDACLTWIGQQIKNSLKRSADVGCRYGGEEFCLILPVENSGARGIYGLHQRGVQVL